MALPTAGLGGSEGLRGSLTAGPGGGLLVDLRGLSPSLRRPVVFALLDQLVRLECREGLVLVFDHEPAGFGYQLQMRKESRGLFDFHYDQRLDGAWVALVRRRWS